jgi:tRNA modification GTPase
LIAAPTDRAARVAAAQLGGALSRVVDELRERLIGVAAHLEASIDFSEEDIGELDRARLADECRRIVDELRALAATHARGRLLREGLHVAIVGKPNVGKSSLLNRLFGAERAIVTAVPGTTRDVIEEAIDVDGVAVVLADTAGIRSEPEEIERIGIGRTLERIEHADVVLAVLDNSRAWDAEDEAILAATRHKRCILLINKVDLESKLCIDESIRASAIRTSAVTGDGIDTLKSALVCHAELAGDHDGIMILRDRQRLALESAGVAVGHAIESFAGSLPPDVIAVDIMAALDHLGEIVGRTSVEAVLDRIFSEFCIGK